MEFTRKHPIVKVIDIAADHYGQGSVVGKPRPVKCVTLGGYYLYGFNLPDPIRVKVVAIDTTGFCTVCGPHGRIIMDGDKPLMVKADHLRQRRKVLSPCETVQTMSHIRDRVKVFASVQKPRQLDAKPKVKFLKGK